MLVVGGVGVGRRGCAALRGHRPPTFARLLGRALCWGRSGPGLAQVARAKPRMAAHHSFEGGGSDD